MNQQKIRELCAKVMGLSPAEQAAICYDPLEKESQADALLEKVADGRCWYLMRETAGYICYIETLKEKATPYCKTQKLAKVLCSLRASPEVTAEELEEALIISDLYGTGEQLPVVHPDPAMNKDILIEALCAKLDIARKALNECTYLQLIEPANTRIKGIVNWALDETAPKTFTDAEINDAMEEKP